MAFWKRPILFALVASLCSIAVYAGQPPDAAEPQRKRLKVFILAGQSNMQGHAQTSTIEAMRFNPQFAPLQEAMRAPDGAYRTCERVWIASLGSAAEERIGKLTVGFGAEGREAKIGPEYTFGITMETLLDDPILIIKTAWGGKSLHTDFRPPSAGPYIFTEQQQLEFLKQGKDMQQVRKEKEQATGYYYRAMIEYVQLVLQDIGRVVTGYDPASGYELSGFVWFQGWNDMVDTNQYPNRDQEGGYDQYSELLTHFIRDVRTDLAAPSLPFVIGVLGVGGPTDLYDESQQRYRNVHQNFRDAMAAPAKLEEFEKNVSAVLTEKYWDMQVTSLRQRERALKPQIDRLRQAIKDGQLGSSEGQTAIEQLYVEDFSQQELAILRTSVSNAEFHYLGSAGILGSIGKAFAESMFELQQNR